MLEFENENVSKDNRIESILKKSENDIKVGKITRKSDEEGREEFLFSGDGIGLVFEGEAAPKVDPAKEEVAAPVEQASLSDYEKNAPRVEEVVLIEREEQETVVVEPPVTKEEFSLPTSFVVDERYNTPITEERRPYFATYVPKFTEVSENFRMADSPRPPRSIPKAEAPAPLDETDPTAEEEASAEGIVVEQGSGPVSEDVIMNITKPAPAPAAPKAEPSVEDEKKKIEQLLVSPEAPAEKEAEVSSPLAMPEEAATLAAPAVYEMPDPEEETLRVLDYPEDLGGASLPDVAEPPVAAVRKLFAPKEYESIGQKMAFKDMFLDRLNSVAVRLGAAILLSLVLLLLENLHLFGVDVLGALGFEGYPFLLVLLDLQIVLCLFLLAMPEIMRGVRALTKGMFHSELLLPVAFLLQLIQTVTVMIVAPTVDNLCGFVFSLCAIGTIVGSYLRHYASFLTFRHVGGREEKIAVERKITRKLTDEKFALDGAVDEYKSKTARFVRAGFISGFFARERKSAESTRYNLKYLLLSLGLSLVVGIVMFFLGSDGMLDATSSMAMTFYFCAPTALLLMHRLPYYFSARAASARDGGVIGETSHLDYAGVDVVTFEDTEVFEKGNVSLKHIVIYNSHKEFTVVLEQMSSLFSRIGGPLDTLFSEMLVKKCPAADEAVLENGGVYGRIGESVFHVGTESYILSKEMDIANKKDNRETEDPCVRVMYAAENGVVFAKFYLQYKLSSSFEALLPEFSSEKIVSLIYTKDFNITNELMRHLCGGGDCVRVMKSELFAPAPAAEKAGVGLAAKDKSGALSLILLCHRYAKLEKTLLSAFWFVLGSGVFFGAMLSVFGLLFAVPSCLYGLWQLAAVIAIGVYAYRSLCAPKRKEAKEVKNLGEIVSNDQH